MITMSTITSISAITFSVQDMKRSVQFYNRLGFQVIHGGSQAPFTTLTVSGAIVNLIHQPQTPIHWWGRVIFRVEDADACYRLLIGQGIDPHDVPQDATWGERYFHVSDPDGHELSFAQLLAQ